MYSLEQLEQMWNLVSTKHHPKFHKEGKHSCSLGIGIPTYFPIFSIQEEHEQGILASAWSECEDCDKGGEVPDIAISRRKNAVTFVCSKCNKVVMRVSGIWTKDWDIFVNKKFL